MAYGFSVLSVAAPLTPREKASSSHAAARKKRTERHLKSSKNDIFYYVGSSQCFIGTVNILLR